MDGTQLSAEELEQLYYTFNRYRSTPYFRNQSAAETNRLEQTIIEDLDFNENAEFPPVPFQNYVRSKGKILADCANSIFGDIYVPAPIFEEIIVYTMDLIPGIYTFKGNLTFGATYWGDGNDCTFTLVLSSNGQIIGGVGTEGASFEYRVTRGSFTYDSDGRNDSNNCFEFSKWFRDFRGRNYQYKVWGKVIRDADEKLTFAGKWMVYDQNRGGCIVLKLNENGAKFEPITPGKYQFFGDSAADSESLDLQQLRADLTFHPNNTVSGSVFSFGRFYLNNRRFGESVDDVMEVINNEWKVPKLHLSSSQLKVISGHWKDLGDLTLHLDNGKTCVGFFDGTHFLGTWHHNANTPPTVNPTPQNSSHHNSIISSTISTLQNNTPQNTTNISHTNNETNSNRNVWQRLFQWNGNNESNTNANVANTIIDSDMKTEAETDTSNSGDNNEITQEYGVYVKEQGVGYFNLHNLAKENRRRPWNRPEEEDIHTRDDNDVVEEVTMNEITRARSLDSEEDEVDENEGLEEESGDGNMHIID